MRGLGRFVPFGAAGEYGGTMERKQLHQYWEPSMAKDWK